jgi:hypothetical protein
MADTDLRIRPFGGAVDYIVKHTNIDSYAAEPVLAEDGMVPIGFRLTISGTGLMTEEAWGSIRLSLSTVASRLAYAQMYKSGPSYLINVQSSSSSIGGPFLKITGTEVIGGGGLVLVRFEVTDQSTICDTPVVAHTWTQRFSLDAAGRATRSINGVLRVARNTTANTIQIAGNGTWQNTAPWADLFRRAILPDVPTYGWRRESQEFAYDVTSTALMYQVIDKQYAYDLPDGVRVGDMEFSYERTLEEAGVATCTFTCDLTADLSLKGVSGTTPTRLLVEAAVILSKTRINANYGNVLITRMRVTEKNLLSEYSIRFEVDCKTFPQNPANATVMTPLSQIIGQTFTVTRTTPRVIDAYGPKVPQAGINRAYAMVPHWLNNLVNGMNCQGELQEGLPFAQMNLIEGANEYGAIGVIVTGNGDGVPAMNSSFNGKYVESNSQSPNNSDFTEIVAFSTAITKCRVESNFVRFTPCDLTTADYVVQNGRPRIRLVERVEISRANKAPAKKFRALPDDAILLSEDWNVSFGRFDGQGNRIFTGVYERVYELIDAGTDTTMNGFKYEGAVPGPWGTMRIWNAPSDIITPTMSPLGTDASQIDTNDVFVPYAAAPLTDSQYSVPDTKWTNS